MTPEPGRLLVVCTGNVCRSPLAMLLLQRELGAGWQVSSAGTRALSGEPMTDRGAAEARKLGLDPSGFVARQLDPSMVAAADLVVTATLDHRSQVVASHVPALRYTFTLLELARLLAPPLPDLPAPARDRAQAIARLGVARRGQAGAPVPGADDVLDPMGGPTRRYVEASRLIEPASRTIAAALLAEPAVDHERRR
ncbi:MAG TPA: hypothetical protein VF661_15925 [Actinomycetales bacterium]